MKPDATGYRLPTEAEWEYAARGGMPSLNTPFTDKWAGTDNESNLENYAWYKQPSSTTRPIGGKRANTAGLHDMTGNVGEWCWDWFSIISTNTDPAGAASGNYRVVRGGDWDSPAINCKVALRDHDYPYPENENHYYRIGFRVVCR
jgi:formylglycine-generating enzyme required for sulfatase activity